MRKKFLSVFMCMGLAVSLVACGAVNEPATIKEEPIVTESSVDSSAENKDASTKSEGALDATKGSSDTKEEKMNNEEIYHEVLVDCYNMIYHKLEPIHDYLYALYADAVYFTEDERDRIGYSFADLDGNGRDELIIGFQNVNNVLATYDENGNVEILLGCGYRSHLNIYENGSVMTEGSSGAYAYSYNFFQWENGDLVSKDFYFTDLGEDGESIVYYHNTKPEWDPVTSEVLDEAVFSICTEVGLETMSYEKEFTPIKTFDELYGGGVDGIKYADLAGTTWDYIFVERTDGITYNSESVMKYLQFEEGGEVTYGYSDEGHDYWTKNVEISEVEVDGGVVYLSLTDELDRRISLRISRKDKDGNLIVQRSYFDENYDSITVNEYYMETMG